jgi:hypothetical protein
MLEKHLYMVEPTGADSPSQNGGTEKWNDTLAVTTRALLYRAALQPKFWSATLTHAAYLHNHRVHRGTMCTPFESWYSRKPQLQNLRVFGSQVYVKQSDTRRAKLDKHDFTGIVLGFTAIDANIRYIDTGSGLIKTSHHAVFDECWFHQPTTRPPAAQLLYDLGIQLAGATPVPDQQLPLPPPPSSTPASVQDDITTHTSTH